MSEGFAGEREIRRRRDSAALRVQFREDRRVIGGVDDNRDVGEVFRCRADHRRSADVDVFDGIRERGIGAESRRLERIEVHHHQIDRQDVVGLHLAAMTCQAATRENPAVDAGHQRFHPTLENLGLAGVV